MLLKTAFANKRPDSIFISLQDYFSCIRASHTEKSNVFYLKIMDAKADSKDSIMSMLYDIYYLFIEKRGLQFLLVEGDAKLYELLQALKREYRDKLLWLIPYPGDWHMLMNYQSALMKPYFDAGLKSLAEACGYPLPAIKHCTQLKKPHNFIMEAWDALYRTMLATFIRVSSSEPSMENVSHNLLDEVVNLLSCANAKKCDFRGNINSAIGDITNNASAFLRKFEKFIEKMACNDDTWRFWVQFVFVDAMAYVSLYLAIRSGDWHLRMHSMKIMAPIFTAFDHPTYQKLISNHISDLLDLPEPILLMLARGLLWLISVEERGTQSLLMRHTRCS